MADEMITIQTEKILKEDIFISYQDWRFIADYFLIIANTTFIELDRDKTDAYPLFQQCANVIMMANQSKLHPFFRMNKIDFLDFIITFRGVLQQIEDDQVKIEHRYSEFKKLDIDRLQSLFEKACLIHSGGKA